MEKHTGCTESLNQSQIPGLPWTVLLELFTFVCYLALVFAELAEDNCDFYVVLAVTTSKRHKILILDCDKYVWVLENCTLMKWFLR